MKTITAQCSLWSLTVNTNSPHIVPFQFPTLVLSRPCCSSVCLPLNYNMIDDHNRPRSGDDRAYKPEGTAINKSVSNH